MNTSTFKRHLFHVALATIIGTTSATASIKPTHADSSGGLRIVVATPEFNQELFNVGGFLKFAVTNQWRANLDKLNGIINDRVRRQDSKIREVRSQLNPNGEFFVSQDGNTLLLRYRVPNNSVYVRVHKPWPLPDVRTTIGYDLDINLTMPLSTLPNSLQVGRAEVLVSNSRFVKKGFLLSIINFFKPSALSKILTRINSTEISLTDQLNGVFAKAVNPYLQRIPPGVATVQATVDGAGDVTLILRSADSVASSQPVAQPSTIDRLGPDQQLAAGQALQSADGRFRLVMQSDGNLVIYRLADKAALWASGTNGSGGTRAIMQSDGNLVIYRDDNVPVWASNTVGGASVLIMQSDGNLVIYRDGGNPVWASGTVQP